MCTNNGVTIQEMFVVHVQVQTIAPLHMCVMYNSPDNSTAAHVCHVQVQTIAPLHMCVMLIYCLYKIYIVRLRLYSWAQIELLQYQ